MADPQARRLLYAIVSGSVVAVVGVLVVGASPLAPVWWTLLSGTACVAAAVVVGIAWRRTGLVLGVSIGLFLIWTVGTLVVVG